MTSPAVTALRAPPRRDKTSLPSPQRVQAILAPLVAKMTATKRPSAEEVAALWRRVVGAQAARHSRPTSLRQGELLVAVDASVWLWTLTLQRQHLLEQLRAAWGTEAVTAIRLRMSDARPARTLHDPQRPVHG